MRKKVCISERKADIELKLQCDLLIKSIDATEIQLNIIEQVLDSLDRLIDTVIEHQKERSQTSSDHQ